MPRFQAIATGYQAASKLRIDVQYADRAGVLLDFAAADEPAARVFATNHLKDNLGGQGIELLHLDILPVPEAP